MYQGVNETLDFQENDLGNYKVLYITPCNCKEESLSNELSELRRQNTILINFFWKINKDFPTTENLAHELKEISDKINFLDCLGDDNDDSINIIKKHFDIINIIEPIIDKIIPEYSHVRLEYKVLLLKERVANQFITTSEFGFNEDQINQLAEKLTLDNCKIRFIKLLREIGNMGLKDAKDLVESKISQYDFNHTMSFPEARKIILEKF